MKLTNAQKTLLRTQPHRSNLRIAIWQPKVIMQCLVNNASIAKNARTIAFDTVSSGSYLNVRPGMTLWIGTSPNTNNIGKVRIRSVTSTTFTVAENGDILWADNLHLTVIGQYEFWPIYPRMIKDPSDDEEVIFYKDYDVAYTNQNSILGSFVCMGSHRAGNLLSGSHQEYWTATGTYNVAGSELTYLWEFEGGSPASGSGMTPGWVTYNTPGDYLTKLTVNAANTGTDTSYRYVKIEDKPSINSWKITRVGGSRDEGETTCDITIYENVSIQPNSVVVIYSEDWYGETKVSLGGNQINGSHIFYSGYVKDGSIEYDYDKNSVSFTLTSIVGLMKDTENFGVSLNYAATPTTWFEIASPDIRAMLYHYLKFHSTSLQLADFQYVAESRNIEFFDTGRETLYDGLNNLLGSTLFGQIVADRQGKIWAEIMAKAVDNAPSAFERVFDIEERDWIQVPRVQKNITNPVSYVELDGIVFTGSSSTALIGCAPGVAPGVRGKAIRQSGLALTSQTQLNRLCGNIYTWNNVKYPKINLALNGNWRNVDIAPQEGYWFNIPNTLVNQNQNVTGTYFANDILWNIDSANGYMFPQAGFQPISQNNLVGDTIEIIPPPGLPPDISFPPPPPPPPPPPVDPEVSTPSLKLVYAMVQHSYGTTIYACNNPFDVSPTWTDIGLSLAGDTLGIRGFEVDWMTGAVYCLGATNVNFEFDKIYCGIPLLVGDTYVPGQLFTWKTNDSFSKRTINGFGVNPLTGEFAVTASNQEYYLGGDRSVFVGNTRTSSFSLGGTFNDDLWAQVIMTIGSGRIVATYAGLSTATTLITSDNGGASWDNRGATTAANRNQHIRPNPVGSLLFHWNDSTLAISTDLGTTSAKVFAAGPIWTGTPNGVAADPTGTVILAVQAGAPQPIYRSIDGGANFTDLGLGVASNGVVWCGEVETGHVFIRFRGGSETDRKPQYTLNSGDSWTDIPTPWNVGSGDAAGSLIGMRVVL